MGNSAKVSRQNYLKVTDEHFQGAIYGGAKSGAPEAQIQAQQAGEGECVEVTKSGRYRIRTYDLNDVNVAL